MLVRLQDISIKRKLTLIIMTASFLAVLLVSAGFIGYERVTYQRSMTHDLRTLAEIIGNESTSALTFEDHDRAAEILSALTAERHIIAAGLYKNGKLFAQYPADTPPGILPPKPGTVGGHFDENSLNLFHEIHFKGEHFGTVYLKSDLQERHDRLVRYAQIVLSFALISTIAVYFLSTFLQRIVTRPIFHLAEKTRLVSQQKDYAVRASKHGNDELGELIDGFNEMLGQIQERDLALQNSNEKLEKRVQERTKDLRAEVAERRRTEAALQQQFTRISLLNQITQAIAERQDTESILHVVLRQLEDHLGFDFGAVALFEPQSELLSVAALRFKNPLLSSKLDWQTGSVTALRDTGLELCKEGQTVYMRDTLKASALMTEKLAGAGLRSAVSVPLMLENKLFGLLLVARLKVDDFGSGDCEFLRMLSEHVALAAHQANLHAELESAYNELRQTQQTVMQQERLKALGQMASGIAHDVNNALSPVVGFADLLMRAEKGLSDSGKKYLQYIRTAGEDIAHIVARLREFYRRREEKQSTQKVYLNKLVEQVVDMTRPRWRDIPQERGITIEIETELATGVPELVGIESEIREALTNLVLNAVDALPDGGKIILRSRVSRVSSPNDVTRRLTYVAVEVSDTGIGMSEETRTRCLEPFFSTKGKRGTGLGLAMVYGVMERHEGKIEIDSEFGKGTTFRLIFPVRKAAANSSEESEIGEPLRPLQLLCIDDEPLVRELLKELLTREGHSVEVCDNGKAGVEVFTLARQRGTPFDAVITDLGMPYFDGRQVARMIKQESPETPVIMLTGWGAFMKEDRETPSQVDGILSKPPRSRELAETLKRVVSSAKDATPVSAKLPSALTS